MAIGTRIFRVGASDFYGDEILDARKTHTNPRLKAISDAGFTGVWLRGKLRELVPGELFKDFVNNTDQRLQSLKSLCQKATKNNLGVWLFFTEPLGLPCGHAFWKNNPTLKGHRTKIMDEPAEYSLCSSTPEVQNYLSEGFRELFSAAPLAGVILITSSEQVNNCWAHVLSNSDGCSSAETFWASKCNCRRCKPRGPVKVITEVISTVNSAVKSVRKQARVVAWDWSWNMHINPPYRRIVNKLPSDIILMGDFERGGSVQRLGKKFEIEEYSLAYSGPSKRYTSEVRAYSGKRSQFAKLQINTTHELGTVISLPLMVALYRKFVYLRKAQVKGVMASWNFACELDTLNVYAVNKLSKQKQISEEKTWLKSLAKDYFGKGINADMVVRSWYAFQRAMSNYPLNGNKFVYWSPVNYALGYPLKMEFSGKPMGPSWLKHEFGDHLEDSLGILDFEEMITLLEKLSSQWTKACQVYEKALSEARKTQRKNQELACAMVAAGSYRSCCNIYKWYALRKNKRASKLNNPEQQIIQDEILNLKRVIRFVESDKRMGYHGEAKWQMYSASGLRQKLRSLSELHCGLEYA